MGFGTCRNRFHATAGSSLPSGPQPLWSGGNEVMNMLPRNVAPDGARTNRSRTLLSSAPWAAAFALLLTASACGGGKKPTGAPGAGGSSPTNGGNGGGTTGGAGGGSIPGNGGAP